MCMCACARRPQCIVHVQRSEDNLKDLILTFHHHVGLKDQAQIIRPGSKHLYQQNHLTSLLFCFRQKSHYLDQVKLEFEILLPLFPEF